MIYQRAEMRSIANSLKTMNSFTGQFRIPKCFRFYKFSDQITFKNKSMRLFFSSRIFFHCLHTFFSYSLTLNYPNDLLNCWQSAATIQYYKIVMEICVAKHSIRNYSHNKWIGHNRFYRQSVIIINVIVLSIAHQYEA